MNLIGMKKEKVLFKLLPVIFAAWDLGRTILSADHMDHDRQSDCCGNIFDVYFPGKEKEG